MKTFLEIHRERKLVPTLALIEVVISKPESTLGAITLEMGSSISFMSKLVDSAISAGYVTASKQKLDRRVKCLSVTTKGKSLLNKYNPNK